MTLPTCAANSIDNAVAALADYAAYEDDEPVDVVVSSADLRVLIVLAKLAQTLGEQVSA